MRVETKIILGQTSYWLEGVELTPHSCRRATVRWPEGPEVVVISWPKGADGTVVPHATYTFRGNTACEPLQHLDVIAVHSDAAPECSG